MKPVNVSWRWFCQDFWVVLIVSTPPLIIHKVSKASVRDWGGRVQAARILYEMRDKKKERAINGQDGTLLGAHLLDIIILDCINFCILQTYLPLNELFKVCVSWYSDDCSLHKVHYNLSLSVGGGRHNRETLYKDTLLWFYRKLIFLQRKNKIIQRSIHLQCVTSTQPVTTISLSQILLVSSLFLLSIIFWRKGSIKLFITDKDEFIAEKMC